MQKDDYMRIEGAIGFLIEQAESQPSLSDLSRFMGLSEFHCQRLFKRWAGITPKSFLQIVTLAKAKRLLQNSHSLLDTSLAIGLSGTSRLHDLFVTFEAMTPGQYKLRGQGLRVFWASFPSPMGNMILGRTDRGICSLAFGNEDPDLRFMRGKLPHAEFVNSPAEIKADAREICARMIGQGQGRITLLLSGSPFQVKVWQALLSIPDGRLTTYQNIAGLVGCPKAVRAVGTAVGANPVAYLIPCHRVIKSSGAIGDYHWDSRRKTALISAECGRYILNS